jgi:hypothetical protein
MTTFVTLPPAGDDAPTPDGYQAQPRRCFSCARDFRVCRSGAPALGVLAIDVPCPYCGASVEVALGFGPGPPILIQAYDRTEAEWRRLRLQELERVLLRTARVQLEACWRRVKRVTAQLSARRP